MSATALIVKNPLRYSERETHPVEAGMSVEAVADLHGLPGYVARINGAPAAGSDVVKDGDVLVLFRAVGGFEAFAVNLLISLAVSAAFSLLFPPPKPAQRRDEEESPTYSFGGVSNNRSEGQPIPISFGRIKSGGQIVAEFIDVQGVPSTSTYHALIAYGEGPYNSIGGIYEDTPAESPLTGSTLPPEIEINGNPASNYDGVRAWVRLGTNEQSAIPGFSTIRQTFQVGTTLTSEENAGAGATTATISGYSVANALGTAHDAIWDEYAVAYDLNGEDVDGFVIGLRAVNGYYRQNSTTGATESADLGYQVRYIELDGGGAPITSGGPSGDGYVRLTPRGPFSIAERSPFDLQERGTFIDPQTYQNSAVGFAVNFDNVSGDRLSFAADATQPFGNGQIVNAWSVALWVNIQQFDVTNTIVLCDSYDSGANRGFRLSLETVIFQQQAGNQTVRGVLTWRYGNGSTEGIFVADFNSRGVFSAGNTGGWKHIVVAMANGVDPEIFIDGTKIATRNHRPGSPSIIAWTRQALRIGGQFDGQIDDVKLYNARLASAQAAAEHGNGSGLVGSSIANSQLLIFEANHDATGGGVEQTGAGWWTTPTLSGSAATGTTLGVVRTLASGTFKRSQYRVEILRFTRTSTAASVANEVEVDNVQSVLSEGFTYPNTPLLGIQVDATEQLNDGTPTVTAINETRPGAIWDGGSTVLPAIRNAYTANPAWVALGMVLDRRVGLGRFYDSRSVDLPSFLAWATYCDHIVYDGTARVTLDNPSASGGTDADFVYDATVTDPDTGQLRGSITFEIDASELSVLPTSWVAGNWLQFSGLPDETDPAVNVDPNSPANTGYEIITATQADGVWSVVCYWDRLAEGEPWTDADLGDRLGADALGDVTQLDGAIVQGASRRFEANGTFDRRGRAWDSLLDVCAIGRATPIPTGSSLRIRHAAPREPVGLITPSNIIEGSFRVDYSSPKTRENALTLNILDEAQGYEPVPIQVQDPALESITNQSFVRQGNRQLFGVTDAGQAERHGNHILAVNRLQRRSGAFDAALDALPYEAGDVLRVSSDVLPRGQGGRIAANSRSNWVDMLSDREAFGGGAWTATSVTVTPNTDTDPYGDAVADTISGAGYVEQALAPNIFEEGWYTVSLFIKDGANGTPALELATDRSTSSVSFDLAALTATASASFDLPAKGGIQDVGSSWRFAWASFFVKAADGQRRPATLDFRIYPVAGDGAGAVIASKVIAAQSEFPASFPQIRTAVLDAEVEVAAVGATKLHLQDIRGNLSTATIDTTLTPPGTYPAGAVLFTSGALAIAPTRGNPVIVSTVADELLVEIKGVGRAADLRAAFEWVEYDEDVYADDATEEIEQRGGGSSPAGGNVPSGVRPISPSVVTVASFAEEDSAGSFRAVASVGWEHVANTRQLVTGTSIFFRSAASAVGTWTLAGSVSGLATSIEFPIPGALEGEAIEIAVVPTSRTFRTAVPERGTRAILVASALAWRPEAPDTVSVSTAGLEAVYGASYASEPGDGRRASRRLEIRRGGWILGQPVVDMPEGSLDAAPSGDVYAPDGAAEVGALYARFLSRAGSWSATASTSPSPGLPLAAELPEIPYGPAEEWETSSAGSWASGTPPIEGPTIGSNMQEHADGYLEFGPSGLEGTYTTARDAAETLSVGQSREPRTLYVGAACEARQVHPITVEEMTWAVGSLEGERWTVEGPIGPTVADGANCTLEIQCRLNGDGTSSGWGAWRRFRCGVYSFVDIQFRLRVTRPSTTYNVRIDRFHTTIRIPRRSLSEQTSRDIFARSAIL